MRRKGWGQWPQKNAKNTKGRGGEGQLSEILFAIFVFFAANLLGAWRPIAGSLMAANERKCTRMKETDMWQSLASSLYSYVHFENQGSFVCCWNFCTLSCSVRKVSACCDSPAKLRVS